MLSEEQGTRAVSRLASEKKEGPERRGTSVREASPTHGVTTAGISKNRCGSKASVRKEFK